MDIVISKALREDLPEILRLQYLAYQTEAALFGGKDIPPLRQTLEEVEAEFAAGIILKASDENGDVVASVRARESDGTVRVGKLMTRPDLRRRGLATRLLAEVEKLFPGKRYELFTSDRSADNIRLYTKAGYRIFDRKAVDDELVFVYMEKTSSI